MADGAGTGQAEHIRGGGEPGLRIGALGRLTATRQGAPLELGGRRQRAVLALLLLARGRIVSTDRLIDSLWDEAPPSALNALHAYVSHLRRRLEPDRAAKSRTGFIVREGSGYALRIADEAVDAWRFEHSIGRAAAQGDPARAVVALREALALWRGPLLAEYTGQPWAVPEAARMAELREVARERLLAARLDCGESGPVVPEAEALVAEDPLREERWRLLALALYRSRRRSEALSSLRRARALLVGELGIDPGPALLTLEAAVLDRAPALMTPTTDRPAHDLPAHDRAAAPAPSAASATSSPSSPPEPAPQPAEELLDRDRELADLRDCVAGLSAGESGLVLIEGPAGIGKSRLLAELRRLADDRDVLHDVLVLQARGSRRESAYGFGAVRQLLKDAVAGAEDGLLTGAAAAARVFDADAGLPGPPVPENFAVLSGLCRVVTALAAGRPVLLCVDDLQWCDTASLHFLAHLAQRLDDQPVLIAVAVRTGEPAPDDTALTELTQDAAAVHVHPAPLGPEGVAALVRRSLGETAHDTFAEACHRTTAGNPLLLHLLLRALRAEDVRPRADQVGMVTELGSRAVTSLVLAQLSRLPPASATAARAVAVLGDGAELPAVARLVGLSESAAAEAVAPLVRAEVLRDRYPLGFVHPLIGDAVYRDLPSAERRSFHERAARTLYDLDAVPERISAQLLLAPHRGEAWVVETLCTAAAAAAGRGATGSAAIYLERALREPPHPDLRPGLRLALGRAAFLGDGPTAALPHLREAYRTLSDPVRRAAAARLLTGALLLAGRHGEPTEFARQAAGELPAGLADDRQALEALARISGYLHGLDPARWRGGADPAVEGEGPGARMLAAALAMEAFMDGVDRAGAVELARFALADRALLTAGSGPLWSMAGVVLHMAGDDVSGFWTEVRLHAERQGSLYTGNIARTWQGYTQWCHGYLREALALLTSAQEPLDLRATVSDVPYARHAFTVGVLIDLGDTAGARAHLDRLGTLPATGPGSRLLAEARAAVLLAEERHPEALAVLDELARTQAVSSLTWWPGGSLRAQVLAAAGRRAEAVAVLEQELTRTRKWGAPVLLGRNLRLLGELRGPEGLAELREAVTLLAPSLAVLEYARALHALALHSPPDDAGRALRQAGAVAGRCGAEGLLRTVNAASDRLPAAGRTGQEGLLG
ncbi:BTAD domain-containing putative transcriptional regulator [Streptomyces sp. NPDC002588]|uniref:BTAD domain-containing putative transcriptional regulator n=1 Tax=Streptomyces sp. NPDC002588 TaxID=3154419 RepID=UPI003322235D